MRPMGSMMNKRTRAKMGPTSQGFRRIPDMEVATFLTKFQHLLKMSPKDRSRSMLRSFYKMFRSCSTKTIHNTYLLNKVFGIRHFVFQFSGKSSRVPALQVVC